MKGGKRMEKLSDLPNIGKEVERQLNQVGIMNKEDLENTGSTEAWLKIQAIDPSACIHRLMALEGAIQGIKKTELSEKDKKYLKDFYQEHKR
jgi:DNA transformation protein